MHKNNYRLPIYVVIAGILIIIGLSVVYVLTDGGSSGKDKTGISTTPSPSPELTVPDPSELYPEGSTNSMNAIIKGIDLDNAIIVAQERGSLTEYEFTYNGATDIRTAYDRQITAALLKPGDFVVLYYDSDNLLRRINGSKDVDIYRNAFRLTHDSDLRKITIGDNIYRYGDDLLVLNDGYFVSINTLTDLDVISIFSVDDYIYLINVEKGHGYFQMVNHSYFTGGTLKIGKSKTCEITEDLFLTLEEGEYNIVVEHDDFIGEATILIERDMTTKLDMSAYTPESALKGFFVFDISPAGSLLYIDGVLTPYDSAVELSHGEHWIEAAAGGYTPYTGFIEVGDNINSLSIMLSPSPSKTPDILYENTEDSEMVPSSSSGTPSDNEDPQPESGPSGNDAIVDSTSDNGDVLDNGSEDSTDERADGSTGDRTDGSTGDGELPKDDNADNSGNNTDNNSSNDHSIIIHASEGAAVFIDDTYKGTVKDETLTIPADSGTHTVRLTKEGYLTRRYTIFVEDNAGVSEFTFPELVAE